MESNNPLAGRPWEARQPGRLIGRGHPAGDFLEAFEWELLSEGPEGLRVDAHLPDKVRNPRGQLFGGFTPTYVDLISLLTVHATEAPELRWPRRWLATTSMHLDYFAPIMGPRFVIESGVEQAKGRTRFVRTRFFQDGELAVHALTTMRVIDLGGKLGDA